MSNRKRRQKNQKKLVEKICAQATRERNQTNKEKDKPVKSKTWEKSVIQSCKKETDHGWKKLYEINNNTQTKYFCVNCPDYKIVDKIPKEKFVYTKQPHEIKHHGPAEHHPNPRKYTAPEKEISWNGNPLKKEEIFNRCVKNNKILSSENPTNIEICTSLDKIIPLLILDECIAHQTLVVKLSDEGYDGKYLARGTQDDDILEEIIKKNAILITEDEEFYNRVLKIKYVNDPIYLVRNSETIMENLHLIIKHMREFEQ